MRILHPAAALTTFGLALPSCTELDATSCFAAGTMIDTPSGPRPIETLRVGQWVVSHSLRLGQLVARRVRKIMRGKTRISASVERNHLRNRVQASPSPPYFSPTLGSFAPLASLGHGATLLTLTPGAR